MTDAIVLSAVEARVLGALIEKALTTPEYYPLTLHALQAACNQKSNRDPVMQVAEKDVVRALDSLREKRLAWSVDMAGSRVPKYRHAAAEGLQVEPLQLAVLAELMLRGPQTLAELRGRAERMHAGVELAAVEAALRALCERTPAPLAHRGGRLAGQRGERYTHGLCGAPAPEAAGAAAIEPARLQVMADDARLAALESDVAALRGELRDLQTRFDEFRQQLT